MRIIHSRCSSWPATPPRIWRWNVSLPVTCSSPSAETKNWTVWSRRRSPAVVSFRTSTNHWSAKRVAPNNVLKFWLNRTTTNYSDTTQTATRAPEEDEAEENVYTTQITPHLQLHQVSQQWKYEGQNINWGWLSKRINRREEQALILL